MKIDRRDFFKIATVAALGVAGKQVADVFAGEEQAPAATKRLAMAIDVKKCQAAQAEEKCHKECISACHNWHNVPDLEDPRHTVRWIWTDKYENLFPEQEHQFIAEQIRELPMIALCNHCDNPPCVRVCPTKATFKREADGIVMFDPHRCLGCRYCAAACPFGARSFNWERPKVVFERHPERKINHNYPLRDKGVVEKCNFCEDLLATDPEAKPRCVEACPVGAMMFGDLKAENSPLRDRLKSCYTIRRKPSLGTNPQVYYIV